MPLWVFTGVSGSGKSSLARLLASQLHWPCLDADDFHPASNLAKMSSGQALDETDREPWLQAVERALRGMKDQDALLAFPGLKPAHRERIAAAAGSARFCYLKIDLETAQERLKKRGGFFPPDLAVSQFEALEADPASWELDASLPLETQAQKALLWMRAGSAGVIGLGRMGLGMARRLRAAGVEVRGWDQDAGAREVAAHAGVVVASGLPALLEALPWPRRLLLSLPAGEATQAVVEALLPGLKPGDLLIDAANAQWHSSQTLAARLAEKDILFTDAGVSGGIPGAENGYCVMAGGEEVAFERARPLLEALAAPGGLLHVGPAGMGHLVKTVHNGVEYGLMQAYAEGFELLKASGGGSLPLARIAALWGHGAVVRSWLLELAAAALEQDEGLARFEGRVGENATGRWSAELASQQGVKVPALQAALNARAVSRETPTYGSKLLSALRSRFGGHGEAAVS